MYNETDEVITEATEVTIDVAAEEIVESLPTEFPDLTPLHDGAELTQGWLDATLPDFSQDATDMVADTIDPDAFGELAEVGGEILEVLIDEAPELALLAGALTLTVLGVNRFIRRRFQNA